MSRNGDDRRGRAGDPRLRVLVATILGSSLAFVDAGVVNVALPTIGRDLDLGLAGRQWVFLSYSLLLASLYLVAGSVGDRYGQSRVFSWGVVGFAAASAAAGAAPSGAALIGARALQGAAGAFVTTNSLALLRTTYGDESGRAVGRWTAWTGIAALAGPPLGGGLVEFASWRLVFLVNVPFALVVLWLVRGAGRRQERVARPVDVVGSVLVAAALAALTFAVVETPARGVGRTWWAWVAFAAAATAFAVVERRAAEPLLPGRLFRNRNFVAVNAETFFVYGGLGAGGFFLALFLQSVPGYSPLAASVAFVPLSLVMLVLAGRFGSLADVYGPRRFLVAGPVVIAAGMLLWTLADRQSEWWLLGAGVVVFAVGLSIVVAPITAAALKAVPDADAGIAAGFNNTVSRVGGLVAVALTGIVVSVAFRHAGGGAASGALEADATGVVRDASLSAFRWAIVAAAALSLAGSAVAAFALRDPPREP